MPSGAVYVGRPTKFGNPLPAADRSATAHETAVARYREALFAGDLRVTVDDVRRELGGRDLVCWCPADLPCHADVLLRVANDARAG